MNIEEFKKMDKDEQKLFDFKKTIKDECVDKESEYEDRIKEVRDRIYNEKNPILRLEQWKFYRFITPTKNELENNNIKKSQFEGKDVIEFVHDCDTTELSLEIINNYLFKENGFIRYFIRKENAQGRLDFRRELVICKDNDPRLKEGRNKKDCEYYMGDTMNSFQTISSIALHEIIQRQYSKEYPVYGKNTAISLEKLSKILDRNEKKLKNILVEDENSEKILINLIKLAKLTHTVGNFIAVPTKVFNVPRAKKTKDFFDLTLEGIRQYYLKEYHTPMCELWCKYRNMQWLDKYKIKGDENGEKSWQNFINCNLLQDYIIDRDGKYIVKLLFQSHSFNKIMPKDLKEFADCINNMCTVIEARNERVYKAINNVKQ